jgi:hypothetical protein
MTFTKRHGMKKVRKEKEPWSPSILFDLDGTLVDSVYEHVIAWGRVLRCWTAFSN